VDGGLIVRGEQLGHHQRLAVRLDCQRGGDVVGQRLARDRDHPDARPVAGLLDQAGELVGRLDARLDVEQVGVDEGARSLAAENGALAFQDRQRLAHGPAADA